MRYFLVIKGNREEAQRACQEKKVAFNFAGKSKRFNEVYGYTESTVNLLHSWFCENPLITREEQPIGTLLFFSESSNGLPQ